MAGCQLVAQDGLGEPVHLRGLLVDPGERAAARVFTSCRYSAAGIPKPATKNEARPD